MPRHELALDGEGAGRGQPRSSADRHCWPERPARTGVGDGLDVDWWLSENHHMDAVKVDNEGRILLKILKPGDYYEPAFVSPDVITLRKVVTPPPGRALSADAVRRAIVDSDLDFGAGFDEVRALTREP